MVQSECRTEDPNVSQKHPMSVMASQITSRLTTKYPSKLWITGPLWGESTGGWQISPNKDQSCRKRVHVMMSSCYAVFQNVNQSGHRPHYSPRPHCVQGKPRLPDRNMSNFHLSDIFSQYPGKTVAMGTAITTSGIPSAKGMIKSSSYFKHLLPSFCKTASPGYFCIWYKEFDFNDPILSTPAGREVFSKNFNLITTKECKGDFKVALQFVMCNYSGKPAWAQNDALMTGYNDGKEYRYMTNDDTIMLTNNWTDSFVEHLANFNPSSVG